MAVTSTLSEDLTTGRQVASYGLSDYEKLRLEKIRRNETRMKELGLLMSKNALAAAAAKKKRKAAKKTAASHALPRRRSSRMRKTVVDYSSEQVIPMHQDDNEKAANEEGDESDGYDGESNFGDDAYESPDDEEGDEEMEEEEEPQKKRSRPSRGSEDPSQLSEKTSSKITNKNKQKTTKIDTSFDCANPNKGGLVLEYAKTGRSSCRKCKNKIEKGKPRVGMEAWIVGRNCITWQRPDCLLRNLCLVYERSGKGRCKATQASFEKGELKVGIRCHTATYYYRVKVVTGVLANVVALMRTEASHEDFKLTIEGIDGHEKLSDEDKKKIQSVLETAFRGRREPQPGTDFVPEETNSSSSTADEAGTVAKREPEAELEPETGKRNSRGRRDQPKAGAKMCAKGRVEWKFGGRSCYGTLIPRMETKTHCYARTHKGNVKTLAKGKDYWSMREYQ